MVLALSGAAILLTGGMASPLLALTAAASTAPATSIGVTAALGTGLATTTTGVGVVGTVSTATTSALVTLASGCGAEAALASAVLSGTTTAVSGTAVSAGTAVISTIVAAPTIPLVLGAEEESHGEYTFDCWKPLLHSSDPSPSRGMPLHEVFTSSLIKYWRVSSEESDILLVTNVWDEDFRLFPVQLNVGGDLTAIAYHAERII